MADPRDYKLDLPGVAGDPQPPAQRRPRAWLMVLFNCCGTYARAYRSELAPRYDGQCPRCGARVRFRIGPGGTDARAFVVE